MSSWEKTRKETCQRRLFRATMFSLDELCSRLCSQSPKKKKHLASWWWVWMFSVTARLSLCKEWLWRSLEKTSEWTFRKLIFLFKYGWFGQLDQARHILTALFTGCIHFMNVVSGYKLKHGFPPSRWMQKVAPTYLVLQFCKQSRAAGCTATAATRRPQPSWWRRHQLAAAWRRETCLASCCRPQVCRPPSSRIQLKGNKAEWDGGFEDVVNVWGNMPLMGPYCRCWVASPTTQCGGWNLKTTAAPEQNGSPFRFQWSKHLYCCLLG